MRNRTQLIRIACGGLALLACLQVAAARADSNLPDGWLTDYEAALQQAAAEEKDVLLVFSTSL